MIVSYLLHCCVMQQNACPIAQQMRKMSSHCMAKRQQRLSDNKEVTAWQRDGDYCATKMATTERNSSHCMKATALKANTASIPTQDRWRINSHIESNGSDVNYSYLVNAMKIKMVGFVDQ